MPISNHANETRSAAANASAALTATARRVVRRAFNGTPGAAALRRAGSPQLDMTLAVAMPIIESLESRQLLSGITQSGFNVTLDGNANTANNFDVRVVGQSLLTSVNGATHWMDLDSRITIQVNGGAGNDTLTTAGNVGYPIKVTAGAGNDSIATGSGNDAVNAGAGTDTVDGGAGTDLSVDAEVNRNVELAYQLASSSGSTTTGTTTTGTGTTTTTTGGGTTTTTTPPPTSTTQPASMRLDASTGFLTVTGSATASNTIKVSLDASGTKLLVQCNADAYTYNVVDVKWMFLTGGNSADSIDAGANVNIRSNVYGLDGNDTLGGTAAGDGIWGGTGNDQIDGHDGSDWIDAGDGNDTVLGGIGADTLNGGNGDDNLDGGAWADTLIGGAGYDIGVNGETLDGIESTSSSGTATTGTGTTTTGTGTTTTGTGTSTTTTGTGTTTTTGTGSTTSGTTTTGSNGTGTTATGAGVPTTVGNVASPVARITTPLGSTAIVGQAVHVDGLSSSLNSGTVITARYEWDFGDTTSGSRFNKLVGFNASHVYDTAGTYTVTLRVINEGGKTSTTTTTVTVGADSRPSIYVSYYGNDNNSGASPDAPVRSYGRIAALAGTASNVKVLFRRGDTFDVSTTNLWIHGSNVTVGAYGSGANPVIRYAGPRDQIRYAIVVDAAATNVNIENLTFDSIYNYDYEENGMPTAIMAYGKNITVRGNQFLNVGSAINVAASSLGTTVLDNTAPSATGIRSYFMWVEGTNVVSIGNTVANSTREHIIRMSGASRVLIAYNNLTNLDRTGSGDASDTAKGVVAAQKGSYFYVASNKLNGPAGFGPLGLANGLGDTGARTDYGVFEANYETGSQFEIRHGAEHIMVRNNIFDRDNGIAINIEGFDTTYNRGSTDLSFINNTAVNRGTTGNFIHMNVPVDGVRLLNNLYVAPQLTTGGWGSGPVSVAGDDLSSFTLIDANNWGMPTIGSYAQGGINIVGTTDDPSVYQTAAEWNALYPVGTDIFVTATLDGNFKPTANAGTADIVGGVFTDYTGAYRPSTGWTIGAVQS